MVRNMRTATLLPICPSDGTFEPGYDYFMEKLKSPNPTSKEASAKKR